MADVTTTNHDEIRRWAEKYDAEPEVIDNPEIANDPVGLRLNFPGDDEDVLLGDAAPTQPVSWEEFFAKFDELGLAFIYDDETAEVDPSMAYHFIKRENIGIPE